MDNPIILGLSLLVNGILSVALYFKSGMNKILVEWWNQKRQSRQDRESATSDCHGLTGLFRDDISKLLNLVNSMEDTSPAVMDQGVMNALPSLEEQIFAHASDLDESLRGLPRKLRRRTAELLHDFHLVFSDPEKGLSSEESANKLRSLKTKAEQLHNHIAVKYPKK